MDVPILMYHSLDGSGSVVSTAPQVFRAQMLQLAEWGFRGMSLSELLSAWRGERPLANRPCALTFDDGYRNVLEHAAPVLAECGFSATLFAVSGRAGGSNDWDATVAGIPRLPLLDWSELRELSGLGWEIGAHSVSHRRLDRIGVAEAQREILDSRTEIEQRLSRPVESFAFPYGAARPPEQSVVAGHFVAGCSAVPGMAGSGTNRAWLPRIDAYYLRSSGGFRLLRTRHFAHYVAGRRWARTLRNMVFDR